MYKAISHYARAKRIDEVARRAARNTFGTRKTAVSSCREDQVTATRASLVVLKFHLSPVGCDQSIGFLAMPVSKQVSNCCRPTALRPKNAFTDCGVFVARFARQVRIIPKSIEGMPLQSAFRFSQISPKDSGSKISAPLDKQVKTVRDSSLCGPLECLVKRNGRRNLLQGTLDLIVLRNLETMGPQHAYQICKQAAAGV